MIDHAMYLAKKSKEIVRPTTRVRLSSLCHVHGKRGFFFCFFGTTVITGANREDIVFHSFPPIV